MAVFYTYEPNEFPAMKLFIDENIPEWFKDEEFMSTFERTDNLQGIKFYLTDVKWYESYSDIQGFEQALKKFEKLADEGNKWYWEFVRLGEEVEDIEERRSYQADGLLHVVRSIECGF